MRIMLALGLLTCFITACGGASDAPGSGASAGRANLMFDLRAEPSEDSSCTLHFTAENRQDKRVNLMVSFDLRARDGSELSASTLTAAFGVPENGRGEYPAYSLSGAPCRDLELTVSAFRCFGAGTCVARYRAEGVARLMPPQDAPTDIGTAD